MNNIIDNDKSEADVEPLLGVSFSVTEQTDRTDWRLHEDPLTQQVAMVLPLACFGVAGVYFLMHIAALLFPPPWEHQLLTATGLLFSVICFGLGIYVIRRPISGEGPHILLMFLALGMTAHATLVMHVLDGPMHTMNLILIAASVGYFFAKRSWFYPSVVLIALGWLSAYLHTHIGDNWRVWGSGLMIALALSITLFEARRRTALQMHGLRMDAQAAHEREVKIQQLMQETQRRESLGVLAGGIAHDFNNLLTVIRGNTELAQSRVENDEKTHALLTHVEQASIKAGNLTQLMLVYAGRSKPVVSTFDFGERVVGSLDLVESSLPRGVLVRRVGEQCGQHIEADSTLVDQIVLNLVQNAADACKQGGGEITVSWGIHRLEQANLEPSQFAVLPEPGHHAFIKVRDDGAGITQDDQSRVFEPFFSTKFEGTGLGLAAVRGIVESHRGGLRLSSAVGVGTHVEVYLPVSEKLLHETPTPTLEVPAAVAELSGDTGTPTLLVVDDQPDVRLIARRMLNDAGYEVVEAGSGKAAVSLVDSGQPVDLALVDLTMPDGDGIQAIEQLRRRLPDLPVVLMSGFDLNEVLSKDAERPQDLTYIDKPFTQQQLTDVVRELVKA